jgi:hypothetical protein
MELKDIIERMKERTINLTGCWEFQGAAPKGYGMVRFNGKMRSVHRLSAAYYLGLNLDDKSQQANHNAACTHKNCWNPDHLYVGTEVENKRDRKLKGEEHKGNQYTNATHCVNGHEFTPENTYQYGSGQRRCKQCYKDRYDRSH